MSKPENPPAFPCTGECYPNPHYTQYGKSLRDWFAGQALVGLLASGSTIGSTPDRMRQHCAEEAYLRADAMLSQRSKQEQGE